MASALLITKLTYGACFGHAVVARQLGGAYRAFAYGRMQLMVEENPKMHYLTVFDRQI